MATAILQDKTPATGPTPSASGEKKKKGSKVPSGTEMA